MATRIYRRSRFIMPTFIIIAILFIIAALSSGCQTTTTAANSQTVQPAPKTSAKPEDPQAPPPSPVNPAPSSDTASVGSLATPTEAYKTAYELRKKKDVAGLKSIMSDDIKEFLTMMGEAANKSLDDMIKEMCDKPQADKAESRTEKIKGDTATVEYLTETGSWKTMDFEKVDGKWLLTFPKAEKDSMK